MDRIKLHLTPHKICLNFWAPSVSQAFFDLSEYEKNYDKIYEKDFLNYEGNYSVNHDNVNFFIKNAQLEKYCTQNFINQFKSLISKVDTNLKADPQLDGTIDGLESDYILHTQETKETLDQIRDRKLTCENKKKIL